MLGTLLLTGIAMLACSESNHGLQPDPAGGPAARVRVYKDGRITLDDEAVTIMDLRRAFDRLKKSRGTVLYYREASQEEPQPIAMEVMRAVVDAQLPVRLSTKPDFSDSIGPDLVPKLK